MKNNYFKQIWINILLRLACRKVNKAVHQNFIMMSITKESVNRPVVVIKFTGNHNKDIMRGFQIYKCMKGNKWFANIPGIDELLEEYLAGAKKYEKAQAKAALRTRGAAAFRDVAAYNFCWVLSTKLRTIVQGVCYGNIGNALTIALSANMDLQGPGGRSAQQWSLKKGKLSGSVKLLGKLIVTKSKRYCFQWQRTMTPDIPESWYYSSNEVFPTLGGSTLVNGLSIGTEVFFRFRIILPGGITDWSEVKSIIVT